MVVLAIFRSKVIRLFQSSDNYRQQTSISESLDVKVPDTAIALASIFYLEAILTCEFQEVLRTVSAAEISMIKAAYLRLSQCGDNIFG